MTEMTWIMAIKMDKQQCVG